MKVCFVCSVPKPLSDFYKHPEMSDGRLGKCKACCLLYAKERLKNPEVHERDLVYKREWSKQPEVKEKQKQRERLNPEFGRARRKRWAERNPEKVAAKKIMDVERKAGRLIAQPCVVCGKLKVEAHHEDYNKPLEVIWLCKKHHYQADKKRRERESINKMP